MSQYLMPASYGLALFDPHAYQSYLGEDWAPDQLMTHFLQQMQQRRILLWGTGGPGEWQIETALKWSDERGSRSITGTITASKSRLYFIDYERLSRAAELREQLDHEELEDMAVLLKPGTYDCRIVQLYDPARVGTAEVARQTGTHFLVELEASTTPLPAWTELPWLET